MLLNTVSSGKRRLKKIEWSGYPVLYGLREEIGGKANKEWNWKWRDRKFYVTYVTYVVIYHNQTMGTWQCKDLEKWIMPKSVTEDGEL